MAARKRKQSGLPRGVGRHGDKYRASVCIGGRRVRKVFDTLSEAVAFRERGIAAKKLAPSNPTTLGRLVHLVEIDNERRELRAATQEYWTTRFRYIMDAFGADSMLHSIDHRGLRLFLEKRLEAVTSTTVSKDYAALSKLFRFAVTKGFLAKNPLDSIKKPRENQRRLDFFTPEEFQDVIATIRESTIRRATEHADLFEFFYWTGVRRSEAARITADDVDLHGRVLYVRVGKTEPRQIPILTDLEPVLHRMLPGLVTDRASYISTTFRRWADRLGLQKRLRCHAMRHSFASAMVAKGVPLATVAVLMGHKTTAMCQRYYHAQASELRDALGALRA